MSFELWTWDASRGEAIIRHGGRWRRLCQANRWRPDDLGERKPPTRLGTRPIQLRQIYRCYEDLVEDLEKVVSSGAASPEEVRAILRSGRRSPGVDWKAELRSIVIFFYGQVDRVFARRGCSAEEAFPLILETFRRIYVLGPGSRERLVELLLQFAADVFREVYGERKSESAKAGPREQSLDALVQALDSPTLRCLALWANPEKQLAQSQIAVILKLSEEDVELRLALAAAHLECSPTELRTPERHQACREALRQRLD